MLVCCLIVVALTGMANAAWPSSVKIGLVLDDVSSINATDLSASLNVINSDVTLLSNVTLTMAVTTLSSSQYAHRQLCDVASQGVTTAISMTRCSNLPDVKSTFNNFNIPVINIGPEPCDIADDAVFTNVESQLADMAALVKDLVVQAKWTRAHIFYDSTFSFTILNRVLELLTDANVYATLINLDEISNLEAAMLGVYNAEKAYWKYMIAASPANTLNVLDTAMKVQLRDKDKAWMIINPQITYQTIEPLLDVLDNIVVVRRAIRKQSWMCASPSTALTSLVTAIAEGYEDLITSGSWDDQTIAQCGGTWSVGDELMALTKVKIATAALSCSNYTQYEAWSSVMGPGGMTFTRTAKWNSLQGTTMLENRVFPNAMNGFNMKRFRASTLPFTFFMQKHTHANGTATYTGLTEDILLIISKNLNFTYSYTEPADQYWGAPDDQGNWNGIVKELMDKEVDIAAAAHTITAARAEVVDFPMAYNFDFATIMLKNPGAGSRLTVYIEPLHKWVWLCIVAITPVCGLTLYILMRVSPFYTNQDKSEYMESINLLRPGPCFWYIFGAFWQQGGTDMPKSMSSRFLLIVWWLFVVIIFATYAGNLIAFLTVTKITLPVEDLDDVWKSGMRFGTVQSTALWNLISTSKTGAPKRLWEAMDKVNQPVSYAEGKEWVLNDNYIFITEDTYYQGEAANDCDLTRVPKQRFFYSRAGFAVQKGNILNRLFSEQIQLLTESGVLAKLEKDWVPKQKCDGLTYTQSKPMALADTQGGFIALGLGLGLGVIAYIVELIWYHFIRKKVQGKHLGPITFGSTERVVSDNKTKPFITN